MIVLRLIILFVLFSINSAYAHYFSESFSKWNISNQDIKVNFNLLELEATRILKIDKYQKLLSNKMSENEIFKIYLKKNLFVESEGIECDLKDDTKILSSKEGYLRIELNYKCPFSSNIKIINNALFYLIDSHIHIARIYRDNSIFLEKALFFNDQSIHLDEEVKEKKFFEQFSNFINSGFNHIIGGYDHLIFVLGLLLLINNFKLLFLAITGFSIGHSITLALTALEIVIPNISLIEAIIGFTIMFVALEYFNEKQSSPYISIALLISLSTTLLILSVMNILHIPVFLLTGLLIVSISYFLIKNYYITGDKLLISLTVAFGLVHGFGFGSFLMSTDFDTSQTIVSLLGFNLGVEIGQLVFVGLILLIYKIFITLKMNNVIIFSKDLFFIITLSMGMFWYVQRLFI
tara:strand:- start:485 stop:1702 length:1218 start_codon:yes stop_codon:yes gene_type:complete